MNLKINSVPGFSGTVTVQTDEKGVPLERFWRNRLKDAETDNCVEVVRPRTRLKRNKEPAK